ncbi:hypothetical protein DL765_001396 [Monosporascus sp. GIB2]|nr:hypothetical protein DL765_001396 [Monosporascus sp. GIB2]
MPVTVFTNSPIAAKPSGATPQTAAPAGSSPEGAAPPTTTTALSASSTGPYPPAQPGAAPSLPTPTATTQAYAPQPTSTLSAASGGPPPPQPGAVPVPPGAARSTIPPPPKVGEKYQPPPSQHGSSPSATTPYPPQMSIPAPNVPYPAQQQGTSPAAVPSFTHNERQAAATTTFGGHGGQSLQHPPGYHQNANASELDRYQNAAIQRNNHAGGEGQQSEGGVWDVAKKWAQATGEKLAAAENEVWKRINKE